MAGASPRIIAFLSSQAWASRYATFGHTSVLAIGNFDGIHLGHQAILRATVDCARTLNAFHSAYVDPSPEILRRVAPPRLSTNAQRMSGLTPWGSKPLWSAFHARSRAALTGEFVEHILVRDLHVKAVLVGENFASAQAGGDVKLLTELGAKRGFDVVMFPGGLSRRSVSSTIIRREVAEGDVSTPGSSGRPFALTGEVVSGTERGAASPFPP